METRQTSVLIIEPQPMMRRVLSSVVALESNLRLLEPSPMDPNAFPLVTPNQDDVLFLSSMPDLIMLSLGNPGLGELKTLTELRKTCPALTFSPLQQMKSPGKTRSR